MISEISIIISIITALGVLAEKLRHSRCIKIHSSCCCGELDIERDVIEENVPDVPLS